MPATSITKPRLRAADGSFSAKGALTGKLLRKVWTSPVPAVTPAPAMFAAQTPGPIEFYSNFTADKVDKTNAIIHGVSVMTAGLIARGHDLEVDSKTLQQIKTCAETKAQVPVKIDHKSGAASVCGFLTNFHLEGSKLKADWNLLQTHPQKDQILEVAERMPGGVGLSASFLPPSKPERTPAGKNAARCVELLSVDYVTLPAANPDGMFSAKVDSIQNANPQPMTITPEIQAAIDAAVQAATAPLTAQIDALQSQQDLIANPPALEELAEMNAEQLAELGLTEQDVAEAIEAHNAEVEAAEAGEGETSEGEGELAAATSGDATSMSSILKEVRELGAQLVAAKAQKKAQEQEVLFSAIEEKTAFLTDTIAHLQHQLATGGVPASNGVATNFTTKTGSVVNFGTKEAGAFELAVSELLESGKTQSVAFASVIKSDPASYADYQVRRGIRKA